MTISPPVTFAIRDLQTGLEIISRISLADPRQAAVDLNRLLDSLLSAPPDSTVYFNLLESARLPIGFATEELAKRYLNKLLPLGDLEEDIFQQVVGLWLKAARAYAHCAGKGAPDEESTTDHDRRVATILHRCIHHTGIAIIEYQRARRELPWGLWLDLHAYYASAEEWGVATLPISDALEAMGRSTHCMASYASFLLCDMAGCYGLSVRDQTLVYRWASYWSPLVGLQPAQPGEPLPAFVVDLMQDVALRPAVECLQIEHVRRLDTSRLALQIGQTKQQLKLKIPPAQLSLGDDCSAGQCNRLLDHLSRPWSQARAPRKFRRHATSGISKLCTGFDEMHYFVSGKDFEQPENVRTYNRQEFDKLFAFRHQDDPSQMLQLSQEQLTYRLDAWEVVNQSANGFRIVRSISGKKMAHDQLLALCPHDGEHFLLARTTWLMQEKEGGLIAGIKALPGMPVAIAARSREQPAMGDGKYQRAFLLPTIASAGIEQTLVLPQGWFRSGRVVELYTDGPWQVKLKHVIEDGADFERISFELC